MSDYKLTYFDGLGLGEIIRLIFAAAGVPFTDVRITHDQWPAIKPSSPSGTVPILETGGQTYFQSLAIARYLANKFGLAGKTDLEQLRVNVVVDTIEDALKPLSQFYHLKEGDPKREELVQTYINETVPKFFGILEAFLKTNNGGDGYFAGDGLTWADLHLLDFVPRVEKIIKLKVPLDNYPKLKALYDRASSQPKVAEWIAKRPESVF